MRHRVAPRGIVAGALMLAMLAADLPIAAAQPAELRIRAGIEEAVKVFGGSPRVKDLSEEQKEELVEFVVGNLLFVMAHEVGHVLIAELGLPVLGREEDAVDAYAVVVALQVQSEFSERVLIEAAKGWLLSSHRDKREGNALVFYDEHGLDLQRAFNVVCLMVGSDPKRFRRLAMEAKLPEERQASCVRDYNNASWSWNLVLKPHRRSEEQPKVEIKVEYKDTERYGMHARILRNMGVLEAFAGPAMDGFVWRAPFSIEARACGDPNAMWNFGTRTLTLCYELVEEFAQLFVEYSHALPAGEP